MRWSCVVFIVVVACGPQALPAGETGGADETGIATSSTSTASATDSGVTAGSNASGDPTTSTSSGGDDEGHDDDDPGLKWDHPKPDSPLWTCPVDIRANAEVEGSSPLGAIDHSYAWFGTGGGGKCPYGYEVWLLPSADGALEQLENENGQGLGLRVFIVLPAHDAPGTGRFPVSVHHETEDEHAYAEGTAIIDTVDDMGLKGTFVVNDPAWTLEGEFAATWCELLDSGPCGA